MRIPPSSGGGILFVPLPDDPGGCLVRPSPASVRPRACRPRSRVPASRRSTATATSSAPHPPPHDGTSSPTVPAGPPPSTCLPRLERGRRHRPRQFTLQVHHRAGLLRHREQRPQHVRHTDPHRLSAGVTRARLVRRNAARRPADRTQGAAPLTLAPAGFALAALDTVGVGITFRGGGDGGAWFFLAYAGAGRGSRSPSAPRSRVRSQRAPRGRGGRQRPSDARHPVRSAHRGRRVRHTVPERA